MKVSCVVLLLFPLLVRSQGDTVYVKRPDIVRSLDVVAYTFKSPAHWTSKQWFVAGGVVAGTVALTLADEPVRKFFKNSQADFLDDFERVGYHYGKPYSALLITGGLYFTGLMIKDQWARETALMLASGLGTSTVLQTFFKNAVGRARPDRDLGNYVVEPFSDEAANHSFPSGHTTVALTTSLILAKQVNSVPLKIFFYSTATITAVSRLYADAHWISDLALGGAIAWFCAEAAVKRIPTNGFRKIVRKTTTPLIVKLYPYPGGISLRAQF